MRKFLWVLVFVAAAASGYVYFVKPDLLNAVLKTPASPDATVEPTVEAVATPEGATAPAEIVPVAPAAPAEGAPATDGTNAAPAEEGAATPAATEQKPAEGVAIEGAPVVGGPFALTNQNGEAVTEKTYAGKYMLVFFGFSNCPAICPTALSNITNVLKTLGADADKIAPLFITVDPARDTPETLKLYLQNFDARISALTGTQEQIDATSKAYKVFAKKVEVPGMAGYMMDHSSFIYLMDKEGNYLAHLEHNEPVDAMIAKIRPFIAE